MKKLLSVLLTVMLLVPACLALGEEVKISEGASSFDVSLTLPEGVTLTQEAGLLGVTGHFAIESMPNLNFSFSLAPDDQYADLDLEALTEEDKQLIFDEIAIDLGAATFDSKKTETGIPMLTVVSENRTEVMSIILIDGYFLYAEAHHEDMTALEDAELALLKQVWNTLTVTEVKE